MFIEGAFLKLLESIYGSLSSKNKYEASLSNLFAIEIDNELKLRGIDDAKNWIQIEKDYNDEKSIGRCDLHVDLNRFSFNRILCKNYGYRDEIWIETKFYNAKNIDRISQPKTIKAAKIVKDLLRLSLFIKEDQGPNRFHARYFLAIFNRHPKFYLAFHRQDRSERIWLSQLLKTGKHQIKLSLEEEPNCFKKEFGEKYINGQNLNMKLDIFTLAFEPYDNSSQQLYWGYLIRILSFEISIDNKILKYSDKYGYRWTAENVNQ